MLLFKQRDGFSQKEAQSLRSFQVSWFMNSDSIMRSLRNMRMCFESSIVMSNQLSSDPRLDLAKAFLTEPARRSDNINVHELGDMLRFLGFSVGPRCPFANSFLLLVTHALRRNRPSLHFACSG